MQIIRDPKINELGVSGVYFLVAEEPYRAKTGKMQKTAGVYVGYADNIGDRFYEHCAGRGARLTQVWNDDQIIYRVAMIITGADRTFERKIKRGGHYSEWLSGARCKSLAG